MIPLSKVGKPQVLEDNAERWHQELSDVLARGEKPSASMKRRYAHADIKNALISETSGKCAYCESKIRHISHGDIEHIVPKSKVPAKAYEWSNLTLACEVCNGNKGDYYSDDPLLSQDDLIDPYNDDPKTHFLFAREIVAPRPDSMRALATDAILKLSRGELVERRRERMMFLDGLVRAYVQADDRYKALLLRDL